MLNLPILTLSLNETDIKVFHIVLESSQVEGEKVSLKYTDEHPEGIVLDSNNQLVSGLLSEKIKDYANRYLTNKTSTYYFLLEEVTHE